MTPKKAAKTQLSQNKLYGKKKTKKTGSIVVEKNKRDKVKKFGKLIRLESMEKLLSILSF